MKKKKLFIWLSCILSFVIIAGVSLYFVLKPNEIDIEWLDSQFDNLDEFELSTPFDDTTQSLYQIRSFSTETHVGIDFFDDEGTGSLPFLAMYDGIVTHIDIHQMLNQGVNNWTVEMWIVINSKYLILLGFETWGSTDEVRTEQEQNIFVKVGDYIEQGTLIANLIACQDSAHVHFSLKRIGVEDAESWVVPEPYFSDEAYQKLVYVFEN